MRFARSVEVLTPYRAAAITAAAPAAPAAGFPIGERRRLDIHFIDAAGAPYAGAAQTIEVYFRQDVPTIGSTWWRAMLPSIVDDSNVNSRQNGISAGVNAVAHFFTPPDCTRVALRNLTGTVDCRARVFLREHDGASETTP